MYIYIQKSINKSRNKKDIIMNRLSNRNAICKEGEGCINANVSIDMYLGIYTYIKRVCVCVCLWKCL